MPTLPRLCDSALTALPPTIIKPDYDRSACSIGIVHFGPGAFHRAHQAVYIDGLLAAQPDWAISAVSLHSVDVRNALQPQDGLYALALLGATPQLRVIGSIREVLCASEQAEAVLARLADAAVRLVTLTITEKGYCLAGDNLDLAHPDIIHDLASPDLPHSAIGYIVAGLGLRMRAHLQPYSVLSCDNLTDNGGKLRRACLQYARIIDPTLAAWIETEVAFPRSMVDSITPASDHALRLSVAAQLQHADAWPIQREAYTQWVVENHFCNERPALDRVGVIFSDDIAGYDHAKLRLLNGAHSTLAYLGSLLGLQTVADAMRDLRLASFVQTLMREDIVPSLPTLQGFDPQAYVDAILMRFHNPAIRHLLAQIAWDGSQKLPIRLLATISVALAAGRRIDRLCLPVAAWMLFVRQQASAGTALIDPLAEQLDSIGRSTSGNAEEDVAAFLKLDTVFASLADDARFVATLRLAYQRLISADFSLPS